MESFMKRILSFITKYLIIFLLLCVLSILISVSFSGCNTENNTDSTVTDIHKNSENSISITISYWSLGYAKGFEEAIMNYNRENREGIKATVLKIPKDRYSETVNMLMASGEGPDVIGLNDELLNSYIDRRWILDLSGYIGDSFMSKFPEWAVNSITDYAYRGNIYTFPSSMITFRLIYNRDLFEAAGLNPDNPPTTISQLIEYAGKISSTHIGERKYGFAFPGGSEWTGFVQSMEAPATYSGIYYYDYINGVHDLFVYEPWFRAIMDMKNNGGLFPGENSLKIDSARMQFAEGNIGMMFATSWDPAIFEYLYPAKCNWDVAMPPALDDSSIGKGALLVTTGSCYAINSKTSHIPQAIEVWKYLYSEGYQEKIYKSGSEIPILKGLVDNPKYIPNIKNFDKFIPSSNDSPYPNTPKGFDEWSRMKVYSSVLDCNNSLQDKFAEENERLKIYYRSERSIGRYLEDEYIIKDFDPKEPLGEDQ
jgi:multiple sugar transport system substrate-binding protein